MQLFLRTLSQGLQAFVPVAAAWIWCRRRDPGVAGSIGFGVLLAVPATVAAARLFAVSARKAFDECVLAAVALVAVAMLFRSVRSPGSWSDHSHAGRPARRRPVLVNTAVFAAATMLVIVRQSMEIGATFSAAFFEMRSLEATRAVVSGTLVALMAAGLWIAVGRRVSSARLETATRVLAVLFAMQVLFYGVHEAAEARLLPFSETIHDATEPYGPDGVYGMHFSDLLLVVPWAIALLTRTPVAALPAFLVPGTLAAGLLLASGAPAALQATAADPGPVMKQPFVLFRDTTPGANFGRASVVSVSAPDGARTPADVTCERVSFTPMLGTGSRGMCLRSEPTFFNLFNGYWAALLDGSLKVRGAPMKLEGKPSRARVSPDGKLGAFTVFVFGDGYSAAEFSTRTLLIDMATGAKIADLEEFTTHRNTGERFSAKDFNFWGVTFARDGDTFYASLRTAGKTYLVRGSVEKRSFAVLRENVECPSLSPDGRRIAFKKFVGPDPGAWRIATVDLATMQERLVAGETRYVDDQMEWFDADRILYAVPRRTTASADVWMVPVDGDTPARIFIPLAESPSVVR